MNEVMFPVKEVPNVPEEVTATVETPEAKALDKEMPNDPNFENTVVIKGKRVEIKPTALKYFRNRTTAIYKILKVVPLNEFLAYDKGVFDNERDSDQILFDFLIAVFNDSKFVRNVYDDIDADTFEKILTIFGRINHIDEKEEAARKNREAQANR